MCTPQFWCEVHIIFSVSFYIVLQRLLSGSTQISVTTNVTINKTFTVSSLTRATSYTFQEAYTQIALSYIDDTTSEYSRTL